MSIRYEDFSVENIADIVVLGMEMHEESVHKDLPFDIEMAAQSAFEKIIQNPHGYGRIAFDGEHPVGMVAGVLATHDFVPLLFAYNNVWFVDKERRGTPIGVKLLEQFQDWAKDQGAAEVHLGVASGVTPERTGKALERMGYGSVGENYVKAV